MLGNVEMVARLVLAGALGSVIGFERERLLWAAGLRTQMLVSAFGFSDVLGQKDMVLDPSRVAAQVGKGLTTAASLWAVAAIGLAVGGGLYVASIATTLLVIGILAGVKPIEENWRGRMQTRSLKMAVNRGAMSIDTLHEVTGERASRVRQFTVPPGENEGEDEVTVSFVRLSQTSVDSIAARLKDSPSVLRVKRLEG